MEAGVTMRMLKHYNRLFAMFVYVHLAFGGLLNAFPFMCKFQKPWQPYALGVLCLISIVTIFIEICTEDVGAKKSN